MNCGRWRLGGAFSVQNGIIKGRRGVIYSELTVGKSRPIHSVEMGVAGDLFDGTSSKTSFSVSEESIVTMRSVKQWNRKCLYRRSKS